jgi:rhodanese-related sulfurtransferase
VCRAGGRSARAASFLGAQGFSAVNLEGGMQAWAASAHPLVSDEGSPSVI